MIALAPWQALLDGLGWVVAEIYELIPNYGVTIILLTIVIRLVLLPLGIKQVRSMQHMQIVQPRIKQVQQKFKGNKQRQQEEKAGHPVRMPRRAVSESARLSSLSPWPSPT